MAGQQRVAAIAAATGQPVLAAWEHDGPMWRYWEWVGAGHRHGWYNRVTGEHGAVIGCPPGSGPLCRELFDVTPAAPVVERKDLAWVS